MTPSTPDSDLPPSAAGHDAAGTTGTAGDVPAVRLTGVVKRYPGVLANDRVDLTVARGEIHALMGENGAGKSTLMSILYGMEKPDSGTIEIDGRTVHFGSPTDAIDHGLGMVHQGFKLFPSLTVTDNVVYGHEPKSGGFLSSVQARSQVAELVERFGLQVDPDAKIADLPVGVRQRVEILKLLYRQAHILILDEPTAVLTPGETDRLFEVLRELREDGRTILLVTHKLHEALALTSTITVLRDGAVSETMATRDATSTDVAQAMTGREVELDRAYPNGEPGETALEVDKLTVSGPGTKPLVDAATFTVRSGEIVGVAGVAGNGQSELVQALAGLRGTANGTVRVNGHDMAGLSVARRRAAGLAYVPEDRTEVGAAAGASTSDNLAMGFQRGPLRSRWGWLSPRALRDHAQRVVSDFGVKVSALSVPISTLSGGNQQKAILGREMTHEAPLLIVEQPTRGVDIGAVENIHRRLVDYRDQGHAVLLVSAELSEVLGVCDRILVMFEGRIVLDVARDDTDHHELGLAMAGGPAGED